MSSEDQQNSVGTVRESVEHAVRSLDALDETAVSEHVQRFEAVHSALNDALSSAQQQLSESNTQSSTRNTGT